MINHVTMDLSAATIEAEAVEFDEAAAQERVPHAESVPVDGVGAGNGIIGSGGVNGSPGMANALGGGGMMGGVGANGLGVNGSAARR